jgi:hypothetical protein
MYIMYVCIYTHTRGKTTTGVTRHERERESESARARASEREYVHISNTYIYIHQGEDYDRGYQAREMGRSRPQPGATRGGGRGYEVSYQGNQAYEPERREEGAGGWNSSVSWMRMQAGV